MHQEREEYKNNSEKKHSEKHCGRCNSVKRTFPHTNKANTSGAHAVTHKNCGMSDNISRAAADMYRGNVMTDPQGSYTGRPDEITEIPGQDADDL